MFASLTNVARTARRGLADPVFLVSVIILALVAFILTIALRIVTFLVACVTGLSILASILITAAFVCGITKPMNLIFWLYALGLLVSYCGLLLLREKVADLPAWVVDRRDYRRQLAALGRIELRLTAPTRHA